MKNQSTPATAALTIAIAIAAASPVSAAPAPAPAGPTYHLTVISGNAKTGKIAVSTSPRWTCPDSCPFKKNGCYADSGPLALHWNKVTNNGRGAEWSVFLGQIRALPRGGKMRHNQAGDLPGENETIDGKMLGELTDAITSRKLQAWTYTHKPMAGENLEHVRKSNAAGFIINASANTLAEADAMRALGLPTCVVVDEKAPDKMITPGGNRVIICPVQTGKAVSCEQCMLCAKNRSIVIGFRAHGTGKRKVNATVAN